MIRESNPFARGFNTMEKGFNEEDRQSMLVPNLMMKRAQLQLQRQGLQNTNDRANRALALKSQILNLQNEGLQEKIREFNITQQRLGQNGGLTPYQTAELQQQQQNYEQRKKAAKSRGVPVQEQTPDGLMGSYVQSTQGRTNADKAMQAMPLLAENMDNIYNGISTQLSAGGDISRIGDALQSYITSGKLSKSQQETLSKAGISQDAISLAVENAVNIFGLPKTNEAMEMLKKTFSPRKGDNLSTIHARYQTTFNELKRRAAAAQFYLAHGQPVDDEGQGRQAQQNFINNYMNTNQFGSKFEQWLPDASKSSVSGGTSAGPDVTSVGSSSSSNGVSEDDIKNMMFEMSKNGHQITHDQAAQMIIALKGGGS